MDTERTIPVRASELLPGTYKSDFDVYTYVKNDKTLCIISGEKESTIVILDNKSDIFLLYNHRPCSYNEVYDVYKRALGMSDDIMGVRGMLIKPEDIGKRVYVDELERIFLKY